MGRAAARGLRPVRGARQGWDGSRDTGCAGLPRRGDRAGGRRTGAAGAAAVRIVRGGRRLACAGRRADDSRLRRRGRVLPGGHARGDRGEYRLQQQRIHGRESRKRRERAAAPAPGSGKRAAGAARPTGRCSRMSSPRGHRRW